MIISKSSPKITSLPVTNAGGKLEWAMNMRLIVDMAEVLAESIITQNATNHFINEKILPVSLILL